MGGPGRVRPGRAASGVDASVVEARVCCNPGLRARLRMCVQMSSDIVALVADHGRYFTLYIILILMLGLIFYIIAQACSAPLAERSAVSGAAAR